jgi:hypothetical protein
VFLWFVILVFVNRCYGYILRILIAVLCSIRSHIYLKVLSVSQSALDDKNTLINDYGCDPYDVFYVLENLENFNFDCKLYRIPKMNKLF